MNKREKMPEQSSQESITNFNEVPLGYTPEQAMEEAKRCIQCKKPLCVQGCPVEVDIPGFLKLVAEGKFAEAAKKIISILDSKSKITYTEKMLFITPLCLPDIAKARDELGWMPIVTLEKGLESAINDLRASKGLKGVEQAI